MFLDSLHPNYGTYGFNNGIAWRGGACQHVRVSPTRVNSCDNWNVNAHEWYEQTTNGDSMAAVASNAGLPKSTLWNQLRSGSELYPSTVVKIARAYGVNPARALADIGLITADELADGSDGLNLAQCSDMELVREIERRLTARERHE